MISQLAFFLLLSCATNGPSHGLQVRWSSEILGRHLHIGLSLVKLRVVVAPLVVILFGDLTCLQHGSGLLPRTEHFVQPGGVLVLSYIDFQADFSIHLADLESIVVLQGKQRVHQPYIGVYVRDRAAVRSALGVLDPVSYCARRTSADFSGKPSAIEIFLCHPPQETEK